MREEDLKKPEERLARLEVMSENSAQDRALIRQDIAQLDERLDGVIEKQDKLLNEFSSMKGKIGGALWALGAMVTAISMFGEAIWKYLKQLLGG